MLRGVAPVVSKVSRRCNVTVHRQRLPIVRAVVAEGAAATTTSGTDARTLVESAHSGVLATVGGMGATAEFGGWPVGTRASYILDADGRPCIRLRADSLANLNLHEESRCSLYVEPSGQAGGVCSRVTLLGHANQLTVAEESELLSSFAADALAAGVDAVRKDDVVYRLELEQVFYVGGLLSGQEAEVIEVEDFYLSESDGLREFAPAIVAHFNETLADDVLQFARSSENLGAIDMVVEATLLSMDSRGFVVEGRLADGRVVPVRVEFRHKVDNDSDARSEFMMAAQELWEKENAYTPPIPPPIEWPEKEEEAAKA